MKLALIQLNSVWEDQQTNYQQAARFIRQAAAEACDIVVLPEMFSTGFSMNIATIAEEESGETTVFLAKMAKTYRVNLIAGFVEKADGGEEGKNVAAVYNRGGTLLAKYTKVHPFSFAKEDRYFIPGNELVTFQIEGIPASLFICYDLRFPEVFRRVAQDVQMIFVIANWPATRQAHWETLLRARAIENLCFVIGVNRIGTDRKGLQYPGASHIFSPFGEDLCCGGDTEELVIAEIDPQEVMIIREKYPFLKDMRTLSVDLGTSLTDSKTP